MTDQFEVVVSTTETAGLQADAREIVLCPSGQITANQTSFLMDAKAGEAIIGAFRKQNVDVVIDFEHATLEKGERGERADAAGWITALSFDDQRGLLAAVKWTADARNAISSGSYRYLSPVLLVRRSDHRAVVLHSCGLTNKPAIESAPALLAASQRLRDSLQRIALDAATPEPAKDPAMPVGGEGTSPAAAAAGDPKIVALIRNLLVQIRNALALDENASAADVLAVLGEFIELTAEAATDQATMRECIRQELLREREVEDLFAGYVRANKLPVGNKAAMVAARQLAQRDFEAWRAFMDNLPSMIPPGRITPRAGADATDTQASAVAGNARSEFRANRAELSKWTDEEAFVAMKLREHSLQTSR